MAVRAMARPSAWKVVRYQATYTAKAGELTTVTIPIETPAGWAAVAFRRVGAGASADTALHGFALSSTAATLYVTNNSASAAANQTATVDVLFMPNNS